MVGGEVDPRCELGSVTAEVVVLKVLSGPVSFLDEDKSVESILSVREDKIPVIAIVVREFNLIDSSLSVVIIFSFRVLVLGNSVPWVDVGKIITLIIIRKLESETEQALDQVLDAAIHADNVVVITKVEVNGGQLIVVIECPLNKVSVGAGTKVESGLDRCDHCNGQSCESDAFHRYWIEF